MSFHLPEFIRDFARRAAPALAVLCLVAGAAGCKKSSATTTGSADGGSALPTRTVTTVDVATGDVVEQVEVTGELQGFEEVRIYAQLAERIVSMPVMEGDKVPAGGLLLTLGGELVDAGEKQAQAGLEAARANLGALRDNLVRTRALVKEGVAAVAQLDALESQEKAAAAQIRQLEAAVAQASTQRSRGVIRSPIAGYVTQLVVRVGDLAMPGMPLMTIVRPDRLKAVLRVPERDFLRIEPGMPVTLAPLAKPEAAVTTRVSLRGPVVDRMTRTGLVEIYLPNREGRLVPGATVRAQVETGRRAGVVLVPAEAVLFSLETDVTGLAHAFVLEGERARKREVRVGARQGGDLEITEGLKTGEKLIVQGAAFLRDDNPVAVAQAPGGARGEGKGEVTP